MKIQHIGYFGEDEDVRYLANENTDKIIEYYRNGYGNFSIVEDEPFDTNDIGIDIDDGYDEVGLISPLAADIIGKCKSYTEKSKSGRGFHILVKGDIPFKGKNNLAGVEIYKQSRFFIMTGDVLLYDKIVENQDAIDYIVQKYFPNTGSDKVSTTVRHGCGQSCQTRPKAGHPHDQDLHQYH